MTKYEELKLKIRRASIVEHRCHRRVIMFYDFDYVLPTTAYIKGIKYGGKF